MTRNELLVHYGSLYGGLHFAVAWTDTNKARDPDDVRPKRVTTPSWQHTQPLATAREGEAKFGQGVSKNPALVLRASGLVGLECDTEEGLARIAALGLPDTVTVRSSEPYKRHYWFRPPSELEQVPLVCFRFEKAGLRADKERYLLPPPALHPSGATYQFLDGHAPDEIEIATMPLEVYEQLVAEHAAQQGVEREKLEHDPEAKILEGHRRDMVFRFACQQRRWSADRDEILEAALRWNLNHCEPPLSEEQVAGQVDGAMKMDGEQELATVAVADDIPLPDGNVEADELPPDDFGPHFGRTLTDDGNAYRLADEHGVDIRYIPGAGWFAWDGTRWLRDSTGEVMRRARELASRLRDEANAYADEHGGDDPLAKALLGHARASASRRGLDATLYIARSDRRLIVDALELDADPLLLNAPNGTIDLRSGALRAHERGDLITRRTGVAYDPEATAPTWEKFLKKVLPDGKLRTYAQRMAGAAAIGDNRDELLHVLHGGGANGKTKFCETIRSALGDYAASVDAELFLVQRRSSGANPELMRLRGVRFVSASESEEGGRLNVALVKALTGGDAITARYLYANEVAEFVPIFSPWLRTNHRPEIDDQDEAIWRRVRLVPFTVTIPASERDVTLQGRLLAELPGVLRWIVDGARDYLEHGLEPPAGVVEATNAYREEQDVVGAFVADRCDVGPELHERSGELFRHWGYWCKANGEEAGSAKAFGMRLESAGFAADKIIGGTRVRRGLRLREAAEDGGVNW